MGLEHDVIRSDIQCDSICCNFTGLCCQSLALALQSSNLTELDLSNNDLQDSAVKLISDALESPNCKLESLRLSGCMVTEEGCVALATALNTNPSHLRELDLRYNHPDHPGDLGVQLLSDRLKDPNYTLGKLNLDHGEACRIKPGLRNMHVNSHWIQTQQTLTSLCLRRTKR
ncbi:ribonuclease inhibitor-like [Triplophysa rosa]|uniref:ribonuclease inhibitor-like n=1 Tax=Triplophysa rosa TaxID=992332 RepID=UPI0025460ACE|nr:ribonuclease inhibitor-like [Triplophysa rosa]